ncbi:MAG: hypothetical protein AB1556_00295 [Bacillota bacterium]
MKMFDLAAIVFLLNIPFGYWRANVRKFSRPWVAAIHLPVPLVVLLRFALGVGWALVSFPVLIGAYFLGQYTGGLLKRYLQSSPSSSDWAGSCLIWDAVRAVRGLSSPGKSAGD